MTISDHGMIVSSGSSSVPRVTYALLAYNQHHYIAAAIESAFAQTYPNLEIVLSDDCSDDSTFSIMEKTLAAYTGPHLVRLNRNTSNIGIAAHVNKVVSMTSGGLIVAAAGDDVSDPERTNKIAKAWAEMHYAPASFHSGYHEISTDGTMLGTRIIPKHKIVTAERLIFSNHVVGATEAWSRDIFDFFGPINTTVVHEDRIMAFRASLLAGVHCIPEPLVTWRQGGTSASSSAAPRKARRRNAVRYACDVAQALCDCRTAASKGLINEERYATLLTKLADRLAFEVIVLHGTDRWRLVRGCVSDVLRSARRVGFASYKAIRREI